MGLRFEKFSEIELNFFFGNGVMIAVFQADGIFPSERDLLKIKVTTLLIKKILNQKNLSV